ncbi:MAG: hypothetical protein ACOCQ4_00370 [bacterium]
MRQQSKLQKSIKGESSDQLEIKEKRKQLEEDKKYLNAKKEVFELFKQLGEEKDNKNLEEQIFKKVNNNKLLKNYFSKYKFFIGSTNLKNTKIQSLISHDPSKEKEFYNDIKSLEKEIEEKETRLEQLIYLKKQQEFTDLQKKDLMENKESREKITHFTLILALVGLMSGLFYLYQIFINFSEDPIWQFLISGIFILIFISIIPFAFRFLNILRNELKVYLQKHIMAYIFIFVIIIFLAIIGIAINFGLVNFQT